MGLYGLKEFLVQRYRTEQCASQEREQSKAPKEIHRFRGVASQKLDRDEIQENLNGSADSVFGFAGTAGMMVNRNLRYPCSRPAGKDGNESVHFSV